MIKKAGIEMRKERKEKGENKKRKPRFK